MDSYTFTVIFVVGLKKYMLSVMFMRDQLKMRTFFVTNKTFIAFSQKADPIFTYILN